eukprot:6182904-Pleurochrysis_carterae.AAC.2
MQISTNLGVGAGVTVCSSKAFVTLNTQCDWIVTASLPGPSSNFVFVSITCPSCSTCTKAEGRPPETKMGTTTMRLNPTASETQPSASCHFTSLSACGCRFCRLRCSPSSKAHHPIAKKADSTPRPVRMLKTSSSAGSFFGSSGGGKGGVGGDAGGAGLGPGFGGGVAATVVVRTRSEGGASTRTPARCRNAVAASAESSADEREESALCDSASVGSVIETVARTANASPCVPLDCATLDCVLFDCGSLSAAPCSWLLSALCSCLLSALCSWLI